MGGWWTDVCICAEQIDVLIVNGTIVSMDSNRTILDHSSIVIKNGKILAVEKKVSPEPKAKEAIDAMGKLIMPGLVNTHTHAAMTIFRGYADDQPLMDWLANYIWPAEATICTFSKMK